MKAAERQHTRLPAAAPHMRIGLLGGSFDPAHQGHVMVSQLALRRLGLHQVWWLVSPGNPLKATAPSASLGARMKSAENLIRDPRVIVTGAEAAIGHFSISTIRFLRRRFPKTQFVWLIGADNLVGFHRWRAWREIASLVPIAVIDRPGASLLATSSPSARALSRFRMRESAARRLASAHPPAWVFLHGPRLAVSSTQIRNRRHSQSSS